MFVAKTRIKVAKLRRNGAPGGGCLGAATSPLTHHRLRASAPVCLHAQRTAPESPSEAARASQSQLCLQIDKDSLPGLEWWGVNVPTPSPLPYPMDNSGGPRAPRASPEPPTPWDLLDPTHCLASPYPSPAPHPPSGCPGGTVWSRPLRPGAGLGRGQAETHGRSFVALMLAETVPGDGPVDAKMPPAGVDPHLCKNHPMTE